MSTVATAALVTGASTGIGRAVALALARRGTNIALHAYHLTAGDPHQVRRDVEAAGVRASLHFGNLGDPAAPIALVEDATREHGRIDVLVNNAGLKEQRLLSNADAAHLDAMYAVNLRAPLMLIREVSARLVAARQSGSIVSISSIRAVSSHPMDPIYGAFKAALERAGQSIALELGPKGIRVNAVAPGSIDTREHPGDDPRDRFYEQQIGRRIPLGRPGCTAEVADAVAWLCSPEARYVTGTVLTVDGGLCLPGVSERFDDEDD